jgi:hypothetical protein
MRDWLQRLSDGSPFVSLMSLFRPPLELGQVLDEHLISRFELLQDHLVQFVDSSGGTQTRRSFMQIIWLCRV